MSEKSGQEKTTEQKAPAKRPDRKGAGARQDAKPSDKKPAPKQGGGGALFLAVLALLVAAGAGAGGWYLWQQQQKADERIAGAESRLQDALAELRSGIDNRIQRQTEDIARASLQGDKKLAARSQELRQADHRPAFPSRSGPYRVGRIGSRTPAARRRPPSATGA